MKHSNVVILTVILFAGAPARGAQTPDCSAFTWDMTRELALFGTAAVQLTSADNVASAPQIEVNTLYSVDLQPLGQVAFPHALGKPFPPESSSGGMLKLRLNTAGYYRISIDAPLWIDVLAANDVIASTGFQGRQPCRLIHKSVAWSLPAGVELIVQLAGAARDRMHLAVTPAQPPMTAATERAHATSLIDGYSKGRAHRAASQR